LQRLTQNADRSFAPLAAVSRPFDVDECGMVSPLHSLKLSEFGSMNNIEGSRE